MRADMHLPVAPLRLVGSEIGSGLDPFGIRDVRLENITIDYIARLNHAYDDWMRRARAAMEVLEIDTDRVPLQGETPAFRQLVEDLKRRYPQQAELRLSKLRQKFPQ